ncbi:DNA-binding PadR family transcriptional regulator [Saccharothrix ecbatanensis]|uniref:DNA-binding PadR family transcriptional regulator n=1 Tax=Saccharothrix ecbatanensis TaxID=1105145 RepID=A0A7W9LZH3_9PSEU|nr:PadR family transcriptional regulator [Saccharothrix ecbatanensis]MBB5801702.1 DNA-binding PadR family transcriptional regulator [Saccharothrix ecbatanensis]
MASKRKVGNLLGLAVLGYLVRGPMHPYELSKLMRDHGDDRSIKFTHGSLYMVFGQLEKSGFIAEHETSREGQRPERTVYALTDAGRAELKDWMRELVAEPRHEHPHFVAALSMIGALHPDEVAVLLRDRLVGLGRQLAEAEAVIAGADAHPLFLVEEEYRIALLKTEITFVRRFLTRIDDWRPLWAGFHEEER